MSLIHSSLLIDGLLVGVAGVCQRGRLGYPTIFTFRCLVVFPTTLEGAASFLPPIYLCLWYKVSFVSSFLLVF